MQAKQSETLAEEIGHDPARMQALRENLKIKGLQGKPVENFLVSGLPNIRYLSGFTGSNALLLVLASGPMLITDPRYSIQAEQQVAFSVRIASGSLVKVVAEVARRRKLKQLAVEKNRISFETWEALQTALPENCALLPLDGVVEELRMVKSPGEISLIRESVLTNSRAFRRAMKSFRQGMRECDLAAEIDYQSRRAGAEGPAFETIVAAGTRTALPHARPTSAKIAGKGPLLIDMGAFQNAYASDMTRTLHVGKAPKRFKALYRTVLEAQLAAIDAVRPGVSAGDVDSAARKVLTTAGFGQEFVHSTGHGLGLEIHEVPRVGRKATTILEPGCVITIEPGAYFDGYGGIRIEDTVLVTESGSEVLTPTSKELIEE